jgi:hypothetical protein
MRAWTVDADDIRVAEDFDESLLHRTPEIDAFLTPGATTSSSSSHQGLRKTLLLKAKRVLYHARAGVCLRTATSWTSRSRQDLRPRGHRLFAASPLPWSKVWLSAIAMAC